ncbi:UDP-glycosyltransferase 74B1-like [Coffea eugenioides]|uniref:UDP-glycosyltransferase 74B1-like n=1 Tax=Coffea eugenioides TaxID=49369 RepID=UPI000F611E2D|nr:UDP-glycosyltransferase 74B1-like [Coffea eugenioides]
MENSRGHAVVLTYPAQGHINPLLQFAKCLASKGLKATFATTPYTAKFITAKGVQVMPISDGFDDGGFRDAPNVADYLESFKTVGSRTLTELILKLNQSSDSPVNCLVYDSLLPWAVDVAKKLDIFSVVLLTNSASVCSLYWQIHRGFLPFPVEKDKVPLTIPGLPPLGLDELPSFLAFPSHNSAYLESIMRVFARLDENDWVFANSFEDLENELAKALTGLWPVQMVGPMVPSAYVEGPIAGDSDYGGSLWKPSDHYLKWLDEKAPKSVVFVSFGSMADVEIKQIAEIACGLKGSNHHFLWVIKDSEQEKLLTEFLQSNDEMGFGKIVKWCNQLEVLAHKSVGCFMTHCGWNSTLEAVSLGVPMVALPQWSDQPTNAKFIESVWRVGLRARRDEKMIVTREEIERCVREVLVGEKSDEIRINASKMREQAKRAVCNGGSSDIAINNFVEVLMKGKGTKLN